MSELPERMRGLAVDERRGLPVPRMNEFGDGHDFTAINGEWVLGTAAADRLCGVCGQGLEYWIAFVGGPASTSSRHYVDPPMHEECAEAATRLCPHLAIQRHARAPEHRVVQGAHTPEGFAEDKPAEFFIAMCRDFTLTRLRDGSVVFKAAPAKRVRRFSFVDGVLVEG